MKIYLDLLPQEKKNKIKHDKIFSRILREELLFIVPLLVFIVLLFNVYYILNYQYNSLSAEGTAGKSLDKYQELSTYENKFKEINESVTVLNKLYANHLHWTNVLVELGNVTPDGIYLEDLSTKNYQIFLLGKARTRENLLAFKANLEQSSCFKDINIPLSNLVVKDDIDFQMDLTVNNDCLKK